MMNTKPKLDALREHVKSLQQQNPTVGACRRLSNDVSEWCDTHINEAEASIKQGYFIGENGVAQHFYVRLNSGYQVWIVDPTVRQFTYTNWVERKADTYVPSEEIPEVGVIDESMEIFSRYG